MYDRAWQGSVVNVAAVRNMECTTLPHRNFRAVRKARFNDGRVRGGGCKTSKTPPPFLRRERDMCDKWWCPFNASHDCSMPSDEVCQYEEEDEESKAYDDLGDMIYHQKVDEEICHV